MRPTVIAPEGDLDVATVGDFREALAEAVAESPERLVVDLTEVSFIDSSGLGAIVEAHHRFRRHRRPVAVVAPQGTAAAVLLELSGFDRTIPVYESRESALQQGP